MPIETYKSFALISICLIVLSTCLMLTKLGPNVSKSLSRHAASHKKAYAFFGLSLIISIILFLLFTFKWLIPTLQLPILFNVVVWLVAAGFIYGAVVPDTKGWMHHTHEWAAWTSAWLMMVLVAIIGLSSKLTTFNKVLSFGLLIVMFGLWLLTVIMKKSRDKFLINQTAYLICFQLVILQVTYLR